MATANARSGAFKARRPIAGGAALLVSLGVLAACSAIGTNAAPRCYHASEAVEIGIGFCQALHDGRTLHVSGIAGQGAMDNAVRSVYERMARVLAANGYTFADVVRENVYATDLDAFIGTKEIRKEFYQGALPAATWVQVSRLYLPAFVVEIDVTAEKSR